MPSPDLAVGAFLWGETAWSLNWLLGEMRKEPGSENSNLKAKASKEPETHGAAKHSFEHSSTPSRQERRTQPQTRQHAHRNAAQNLRTWIWQRNRRSANAVRRVGQIGRRIVEPARSRSRRPCFVAEAEHTRRVKTANSDVRASRSRVPLRETLMLRLLRSLKIGRRRRTSQTQRDYAAGRMRAVWTSCSSCSDALRSYGSSALLILYSGTLAPASTLRTVKVPCCQGRRLRRN